MWTDRFVGALAEATCGCGALFAEIRKCGGSLASGGSGGREAELLQVIRGVLEAIQQVGDAQSPELASQLRAAVTPLVAAGSHGPRRGA